LQRVVQQCLEKNPQERFHSAHDLSLALRATLSGSAPATRARSWWLALAACLAALILAAGGYWKAGRAKPIDSLAVMPFVNVGADSDAEYLSDGITENLINNLSQLPNLRIVPRSVVFAYKGKDLDPRRLGRELHVRAILTGKVVQRGDLLHIQTDLVDVGEVSQLWGQQYDRKFSDILSVQEDIARQVSDKLHIRPNGEQQNRLAKRYTEDTEAYQLYLKGRYYWNRRTADSLKQANVYFQQAIDRDPGYGLAYAGLAESYVQFNYYEVLPPRESCAKARAAALKALDIDDGLAEAHTGLGYINVTCDWDWPGGEREFRKALDINPKYATARSYQAAYLIAMGRVEASVTEYRAALEAEPLSLIINASMGLSLYFARDYDQAIAELRKTVDLDPDFVEAHSRLGLVYEQKGMLREAVEEFQKAVAMSGGAPRFISALGHAYAISGQTARAQGALIRLERLSHQEYVAPYDVAVVYMGLNDRDRALKYLEAAYQDRSYWMIWLREDPRFDGIRDDPRYQDLLRRMHLVADHNGA
jgi:eukaryotic-like serine/threonine-protein kinase